MKRPTRVAALLLAMSGFSAAAWSQTTVELNTGFNHANYAPYPTVTTPTSTTNDNYWLTIASYPPISPAAPAPSFVLQTPSGWLPALPNSSWIGPRNTANSAPGTTLANPSYALFRKCFCLLQNYKNPRLSLSVRADDTVQVWLNTQLNQLVLPQNGRWSTNPPITANATPAQFVTGRNCLYVLVEDRQVTLSGFDLAGTISANGLLPLPATGTAQHFEPCQCPQPSSATNRASDVSDEKVVAEILKIAEARRAAKASEKN